jgi:hypothetical protein
MTKRELTDMNDIDLEGWLPVHHRRKRLPLWAGLPSTSVK